MSGHRVGCSPANVRRTLIKDGNSGSLQADDQTPDGRQ
jgi:hypothetical protein